MIKDTPEGQTHYSCDVALKEGNGCCGCNNHDCIEAGAEGFLSQPENTLNVIRDAKNMEKERIDNEFLSKAHMIVSGLSGDLWQITKKEWNEIMGRK